MRRRVTRYAELTSLLDVLFILLFASLIQAAGIVDAADDEPPPPQPPAASAPPQEPEARAALKQRALDELTRSIGNRGAVYAHVSARGELIAIEREHASGVQRLEVGTPLLETVDDPDVGVLYLGDHQPEWRLCTRIRVTLGLSNLSDRLVVFAPTTHLAELPFALVEGLRADQQRCFADERGLAILVPPEPARP